MSFLSDFVGNEYLAPATSHGTASPASRSVDGVEKAAGDVEDFAKLTAIGVPASRPLETDSSPQSPAPA